MAAGNTQNYYLCLSDPPECDSWRVSLHFSCYRDENYCIVNLPSRRRTPAEVIFKRDLCSLGLVYAENIYKRICQGRRMEEK